MVTTVQVSVKTRQTLNLLREKRHAKTYDQLIKQSLDKQSRIPKSMFGALKGKNLKWTKADRADFHEW